MVHRDRATEKVPKGLRSIYKEGEVHYPIYDAVHGYVHDECTMYALYEY